MRDEQSNQRGIMQAFREVAMKGASAITGRPIARRCPDCNEWLLEDDKGSACGEHRPIPEGASPIYISFTPSPPAEKEPPPPVERLDGQAPVRRLDNAKQRSEKWKRPEGMELTAQRVEPRRRTDGGKSRADYRGLSGNPDAFTQRMVNSLPDYEPSNSNETDKWDDIPDDLPIYGLEER